MNIAYCYKQLGLNSGASLAEVKANYRKLARRYHPDVNPEDGQAKEKFIAVTEAYKLLVAVAPRETKPARQATPPPKKPTREPPAQAKQTRVKVATRQKPIENNAPGQTKQTRVKVATRQKPIEKNPPGQTKQTRVKVATRQKPIENNAALSELELQLKQNSYLQLQRLLKYQRFPRAIALVEALAQRMPLDREVRQWQAIAYQRWGRKLIAEGKLDKARSYLKKALKTDPHNRALWMEVERDFRQLERVY